MTSEEARVHRYPRRAVTTEKSLLGFGEVLEQQWEHGDWAATLGCCLWHWKQAEKYLQSGLWLETFDHLPPVPAVVGKAEGVEA